MSDHTRRATRRLDDGHRAQAYAFLTSPAPAEFAQQILIPDQDRVGTDVVGSRGLAERRQHGPLLGKAAILCHPWEEHDEVRRITVRVVPFRLPLKGAGDEPSTGRVHEPDLDPVAAGQRDYIRLPVAGQ